MKSSAYQLGCIAAQESNTLEIFHDSADID